MNNISNFYKTLALHLGKDAIFSLISSVTVEGEILKATFEGKKSIRRNLPKYIGNNSTEEYFKSVVATSLLAEGYLIIPIEGGYICQSPEGKEYQIEAQSNTCTCPHYINNKEQCKHLLLKEWLNQYKARVGLAKSQID